jgi:hypothetical protein
MSHENQGAFPRSEPIDVDQAEAQSYPVEIRWNEQTGVHQISGLHDGWLREVRTGSGGRVVIRCAAVSDERYLLGLPDEGFLHLSGFTGGNVICDVSVYEARACPFYLFAVFAEVGSQEAQYWPQLLKTRFDEFVKTQGFLFWLHTSDGCDLLTLSKRSSRAIELSREPSPKRVSPQSGPLST